jgi:hypothetical protein
MGYEARGHFNPRVHVVYWNEVRVTRTKSRVTRFIAFERFFGLKSARNVIFCPQLSLSIQVIWIAHARDAGIAAS